MTVYGSLCKMNVSNGKKLTFLFMPRVSGGSILTVIQDVVRE